MAQIEPGIPCRITKTNIKDTEDQLLQIARGELSSLSLLYEQTKPAVFGFALSLLKDPADAEEVLQETYLRIHRAAEGYRSVGKPMAWIFTIVRNLCFTKLRERQRFAAAPAEDFLAFLAEKPEVTPEDRIVLTAALRKLGGQEAQIIWLHAVGGMKHREIAEIENLSLTAVLSKYHRGLKKLKRQLLEEDWHE